VEQKASHPNEGLLQPGNLQLTCQLTQEAGVSLAGIRSPAQIAHPYNCKLNKLLWLYSLNYEVVCCIAKANKSCLLGMGVGGQSQHRFPKRCSCT
jgi:hypothetical protein